MSLILLVLLAISPAKDHFSQWRHYQKQYLHLIRGRADAVTLERHFEGGIQQIWIPEQQVTDRCTTCHLGLKENSLADVSAVAFRKHPVDSALADGVWLHHLPSWTGRRHHRRRSAQRHRAMGAAPAAREVHRSRLRTMPSGEADCHAVPEPGPAAYLQLRLHALPHHQAGRWDVHPARRRSAIAETHRRQDDSRVGLRLDQRSPGLCQHGDHAELSLQR